MPFDHPHQLILFGPPGTSKSHVARHEIAMHLKVPQDDIFPLTFHPEFSYGEFVARLLPMSRDGRIEYNVHSGPFLRALARAYQLLPSDEATGDEPATRNVLLLIDEINRGNCAEIFGDVFQLLDRVDDGWSTYEISVSELTIAALRKELESAESVLDDYPKRVRDLVEQKKLCLPPNLYLIGTMNTSDESIFYMDSAFKRRWNFEFRPAEFDDRMPDSQRHAVVDIEPEVSWRQLLDALNNFILSRCTAPKLDDKLVGPWFIKAQVRYQLGPATLATTHAVELNELRELAALVTTHGKGADYSDDFDEAVLNFADKLSRDAKQIIYVYADYQEGDRRLLRAIASKGASPYYLSRRVGQSGNGKLLIEDFVDGLGKLPAPLTTYHIPRNDIVGKLFLYLWDNVFDRDKEPLATLLGLQRQELRTFGQFAARADDFIARLCEPPPAD